MVQKYFRTDTIVTEYKGYEIVSKDGNVSHVAVIKKGNNTVKWIAGNVTVIDGKYSSDHIDKAKKFIDSL